MIRVNIPQMKQVKNTIRINTNCTALGRRVGLVAHRIDQASARRVGHPHGALLAVLALGDLLLAGSLLLGAGGLNGPGVIGVVVCFVGIGLAARAGAFR